MLCVVFRGLNGNINMLKANIQPLAILQFTAELSLH